MTVINDKVLKALSDAGWPYCVVLIIEYLMSCCNISLQYQYPLLSSYVFYARSAKLDYLILGGIRPLVGYNVIRTNQMTFENIKQ